MLGALLVGSVLGGASLLRGNARRRSRQGIRAIDLVGDSRMRGPTSTQGMRFSADAPRPRCPGGHAGDFARCLAPLPPSGFRARILLDEGVFFHGTHGSPGARRAFSGVFSKPGWLHTRRNRLFEPAGSFGRRFGLADGVRRGDNARFASRRAPKRRQSRGVHDLRHRLRGPRC